MFWLRLIPSILLCALAAGFTFMVNYGTNGNWLQLSTAFAPYTIDDNARIFFMQLAIDTSVAVMAACISIVPITVACKLLKLRTSATVFLVLLGGSLASAYVTSGADLYIPRYVSQLWVLVGPGVVGGTVFALAQFLTLRSRRDAAEAARP